jgi:hypothetical protein
MNEKLLNFLLPFGLIGIISILIAGYYTIFEIVIQLNGKYAKGVTALS